MNAKDVEDIQKETEGFKNAWNQADAQKAASYYTEDAVRVGAFGDIQCGRQEIAEGYRKLFSQTMPGAKVKHEKGSIRMLTPELAIWQVNIELQRPGISTPMKGYVVEIFKKANGRWLVLESHPKIFPPPIT